MNTTSDIRKQHIKMLLVRMELWFAPLLIIVPLIISGVLLWDWYARGVLTQTSAFDGELFLGILLLIGNLVFDIPFLRSVRVLRKKL